MIFDDFMLQAVHRFAQYHGEPEEETGAHRMHKSETRQLFPPVDHHL